MSSKSTHRSSSQIFEYKDYAAYLEISLKALSKEISGVKSRFAESVQCHPAYLTRVLSGAAHLSQEQADRANQFLKHNLAEARYFVLIVDRARAGTPSLREFLDRQIDETRSAYLSKEKRFNSEFVLTEEMKSEFYSSWHYAAIMTALTVPTLRSQSALSQKFSILKRRVEEVLKFLKSTGMVEFEGSTFKRIVQWPHVSSDRSAVARDHLNWRLMAIRASENRSAENVHYSSVISISAEDAFKIKSMILRVLEESRKIIYSSKEEQVYSLLVDFFEV